LVTGTTAAAGVSVKVLVERDKIAPMGIRVEQAAGAENWPVAVLIAKKDSL
jgi:hypothetical protein